MPRIIDYADVLRAAERQGLRSLYHNSGAFGFAPDVEVHHVGWIGPPDPTIRPAAQAVARPVGTPYEPTLARLVTQAWQIELPGPAWVLPKSHWKYELDFGSATWLPETLRQIGIDPAPLTERHDGSAIEFESRDAEDVSRFTRLVKDLLINLLGSDFALLFPGRDAIATLHHHKQVWWTARDAALIDRLSALPTE